MLLRGLRLGGFRQLTDAGVELGPGITLITGENGAGKSTLLEAIVWVLFGRGSVRRSERSIPSLYSSGRVTGRLDVELDHGVVTIERTLERGADSSSTTGVSDVQLPARDVFMRACFTGRRELQALSQLDPAGRMDALARLLGPAGITSARTQGRAAGSILATAIRSMEEELDSAERRMAALAAAPDLLTQYTAELERARSELADAELHASRLHDEWAQKRQDVQTRLDAYHRRSEELRRQIDRLSTAGSSGACPTCDQPLGSGTERVIGRLDDEYYITAQDVKWLTQRHTQLERRPPDVAEADTRRERLRGLVADRADRAARCEQAVQELWSVAQEKQRAQERLVELRARMPAQLATDDLAAVSTAAGAIVRQVASEYDGGIELTREGRVYGLSGSERTPVVSGGDEDLFAIALRIAAARIAAARSGLASLLLLDEPFGTLDGARRTRLVATLRALQPPADQILIATQDAALESHADRVIRITREPGGPAHIDQSAISSEGA